MSKIRWAGGPGSVAGLLLLAVVGTITGAADDKAEWRKKALELNAITGDAAAEGQIEVFHKDPATTRKLLDVAAAMAKDRKTQPFNSNATYILARAAQDLKLVDLSQTFYEIQIEQITKLESGQKLAAAYWGLIKLLIENDKVADSQKIYQKYLETEGDENADRIKSRVERLMILNLARQNHLDEALKIVDRRLKRKPDNLAYLDTKARALQLGGQPEQAAKTYESIIDIIRKSEDLADKDKEDMIEECRYALSSIYIDMKQVDKAAEQLKTLLSKKPDNPSYNNDLGFVWADNDMNLEEAEKMIRKAIEGERKQKQKEETPDANPEQIKDNPSYLDSLGWVLFKQKKYKEAKVELLKAVEDPGGQNIEIYDHLADCLMQLGDKKAAVAAWKKGLETAGTSKRDISRKASVEKKIKNAQ